MLRTLSLLMVGFLLGLPTALPAAAAPDVNPAVRAAQSHIEAWRAAKTQASTVLKQQTNLERRIRQLKASEKANDKTELKQQLARSVTAQQTLQTAEAEARVAAKRARQAVINAGRMVHATIGKLAPGLKTGSTASRRSTARNIQRLRAQQQTLKGWLAELAGRSASVPKSWERFTVRVEPLDGPDELGEKADFVEDTRDRLEKKRQQLAMVLSEKRQEREIARAASDFATDRSLFEEQGRTGRVSRRSGTTNLSAAGRQEQGPVTVADNGNNNRSGGGADPEVPLAGVGTPPPNNEAAAPPIDDTNTFNQSPGTNDPANQVVEVTPQTPAPVPLGANSSGASVSRDLRADVLINLQVELSSGELDLATLEKLVKELEALDAHLQKQAVQIRKRAEQLEVEESKSK